MKYSLFTNWEDYKNDFNERFTIEDSYIVCGVGGGFRSFIKLFPEVKIQYCLDKNADNIKFDNYDIYPYEYLKGKNIHNVKFIITPIGEFSNEIIHILLNYGANKDNIISIIEVYHFWGARYKKQVLVTLTTLVLLTGCNLNCKNCFQLAPYIKKNYYFKINDIKDNIDAFFDTFSFVNTFTLCGGEPLLYKEIDEVCLYLSDKYYDKYDRIVIITNGTVIPEEKVLINISNIPKLNISISDYSKVTNLFKGNELINKLKQYNISYVLNDNFIKSEEELWTDIGDPTELKFYDEMILSDRFEKCSIICNLLVSNKIYTCASSAFSEICNVRERNVEEQNIDLIKLRNMNFDERSEYVGKYFLGFLDKGYFEHCKYCNGIGSELNNNYVTPGKQLGR